ncbi:MAG: hypothetical protein HOV71_31075 [Hamadaea sp.]|uniref:hypothetical protein n=1 Tax=Hamadaea sp. NPDC050747 TaxID=3155789 RepID=UPI00179BE16C|nr:hypothetical protein [Hamadaea sp.]NUR52590.1 hypothetical protein [Hamadaea sp.]NUT02313.1 hypothetical protein [Hamadaea sp.]
MSLNDNVTVGLLCLSCGAATLVTVVATALVVHVRHRDVRRQAEQIRRWVDSRVERKALPPLQTLPDGFEEVPEAPVVYAWWTPSKEDLTETAVLPRMTDDILTAEALRFEVTQVLQTIPWRDATTVPVRRGHLDVIDGYARVGRHRAGPR